MPFTQGGQANTEVFMNLFMFLSLLLGLSFKVNMIFIPSLLMGLATLTKTVAVSNAASFILWLIFFKKGSFRNVILYLVGFIVPIAFIFLIYGIMGALGDYWFANVTYNRAYIEANPFLIRFFIFPWFLILENLPIWIFGLCGSIYLLLSRDFIGDISIYLYVLNLILSLFLIQYLGRGHSHYYNQTLPFLVIVGFYFLTQIRQKHIFKSTFSVVLLLLLIFPGFFFFKYYILADSKDITLYNYGRKDSLRIKNSKEISNYLSKKLSSKDYVYNLGRESQIYFYLRLPSASKYFYDRPFCLFDKTIDEVCRDLRNHKPRVVINTVDMPDRERDELWNRLNACANLEIAKKEEIYSFDVWYIK